MHQNSPIFHLVITLSIVSAMLPLLKRDTQLPITAISNSWLGEEVENGIRRVLYRQIRKRKTCDGTNVIVDNM